MRRFSKVLQLCAATVSGLLLGQAVFAQEYPNRPINLVVTVPAGGSIDAMARIIANDLGPALGQPVMVTNRAGAGGNIAAESVAKAPADGYTLLITASSTLTVGPFIYKSIPFDPVASFTPVIMPARMNLILVANPKTGAKTLDEFVNVVKANPGKTNFASSGNGSLPHLAGVLFNRETKTESQHIPYKGIAPATTDLVAGQVDYMFDSASTISYIQSGALNALAVIGPNRLASLPNVRTFKELGYPGMEAARGWYAIMAPAGTPAPVVRRLNQEIIKILKKPEVMQRVDAMGLENATSTPEEVTVALKEDLARYQVLVRQANVTPQ